MTKCYLEDDNISTRSVRSGRSRDFQSESRGEEHVEKEKIVTKKTK